MRVLLGWITFLLSLAFAGGLFRSLVLNAWAGFPNQRTILAFFAFGIPTIFVTVATTLLWDGYEALQKLLGWTGTMLGIGSALGVLVLVAAWILPDQPAPVSMITLFRLLGFGVAAVICGAFGITMLYRAEGKAEPDF